MAKKATKKSPAKKKIQAKKPAKKAAARKASRPAAPKVAARAKWKPPMGQDVIPSLVLRDAAAAIEFYKKALGAVELGRHTMPGGTAIMHAEIKIGDTVIAMNDQMDMPGGPNVVTAAGPNHTATGSFMLYTADCDALFNQAVGAGAQVIMPMMDQFWGDRMGGVADPFGQVWMIASHQKDMSRDELRKAGEDFAAQMAQMAQQAPSSKPPPAAAG